MTQAFIVTPYAAALGLLGAALTINVIVNRGRAKAVSGDGGAPALAQADSALDDAARAEMVEGLHTVVQRAAG